MTSMLGSILNGPWTPLLLLKQPQVISVRHWWKCGYCALHTTLHMQRALSFAELVVLWPSINQRRLQTDTHTHTHCIQLSSTSWHFPLMASWLWCTKHQRRVIIGSCHMPCHRTPQPSPSFLTASLFFFPIYAVSKVLKGHDDHVITCLQFCGNRIVSGSDDNTLKVWSAITGKVRVKDLLLSVEPSVIKQIQAARPSNVRNTGTHPDDLWGQRGRG